MFLIRVLFSEGKPMGLCNASMTTEPGGRKSHCPLSHLPPGRDSEGPNCWGFKVTQQTAVWGTLTSPSIEERGMLAIPSIDEAYC